MSEPRPNFKPNVDALELANVLRTIAVSGIVEYSTLNKAINADVQAGARRALDSARKIVLDQDQMVFGCVVNVGLKRLPDVEVIEQERGTVRRVRRVVRRGMSRLSTVDFDGLPPQRKTEHRLVAATLGAVALCTSQKSQAKLEARVKSADLPVGDAMKLFAKEATA